MKGFLNKKVILREVQSTKSKDLRISQLLGSLSVRRFFDLLALTQNDNLFAGRGLFLYLDPLREKKKVCAEISTDSILTSDQISC